MSKKICTLEIVINGTPYYYEAHSHHRVAEILANQMRVLDTGKTNDFGQPIYSNTLDSFTVHYFQESN
jgi:hypothetical protein